MPHRAWATVKLRSEWLRYDYELIHNWVDMEILRRIAIAIVEGLIRLIENEMNDHDGTTRGLIVIPAL